MPKGFAGLFFAAFFIFEALSHAFCPAAFANHNGPLKQLLAQPERPTIEELIAYFNGEIPDRNPFNIDGIDSSIKSRPLKALESLRDKFDGPEFIVRLESTFPGGTFAFLGRDMRFLADIVDSFFIQHGQPGRVIRLNASKNSFFAMPPYHYDFLRTHGLDLRVKRENPFVIIDWSNWHEDSQLRMLSDAVFEVARYLEIDNRTLLEQVNFVNVNASHRAEPKLSPQNLEEQKSEAKHPAFRFTPMLLPFLESAHVSAELWHGPYQQMQRLPSRKVIARAGSAKHLERILVLHLMYEILKITGTDLFLERVLREAEFQKTHLNLTPLNHATEEGRFDSNDFSADITYLAARLTKGEKNWQIIEKWFRWRSHSLADQQMIQAFEAQMRAFIKKALEQGLISEADLKKLDPRIRIPAHKGCAASFSNEGLRAS